MSLPSYAEIRQQWREYNELVFSRQLKTTKFVKVEDPESGIWGLTVITVGKLGKIDNICLNFGMVSDSEFNWKSTLLHEMFHQYEWEVEGRNIDDWGRHDRFHEYQKKVKDAGINEDILCFRSQLPEYDGEAAAA